MPMTPKEIISLLEHNGFEYVRSNGSHRMCRNPDTGKITTAPLPQQAAEKGNRTGNTETGGAEISPAKTTEKG